MAVPLYHAACFQPIAGDQISGHLRSWSERRVQTLYAEDTKSATKMGPYVVLASGPDDTVKGFERVFKPAAGLQSDALTWNVAWEFDRPEDAKIVFCMLVSTGLVNVWLYVKSEYAHEIGDTFLRPAA